MSVVTEPRIFEMADRLADLRERKEALKREMEATQSILDSTETELAHAMAGQEIQNFVRGGRQFYLRNDMHVSTAAGQGPALVAYLKESGAGDIVQETVHPSTLRGWVKERIEEHGSLPEDLATMVNVFEKLGVGIRKTVQKGA